MHAWFFRRLFFSDMPSNYADSDGRQATHDELKRLGDEIRTLKALGGFYKVQSRGVPQWFWHYPLPARISGREMVYMFNVLKQGGTSIEGRLNRY